METGIRELKNNLSRYVRLAEAGERVVVTSGGRPVAELGPPTSKWRRPMSRYDRLVAEGVITPAREDGDPLEGSRALRLPRGTAAGLIDSDRDET